MIIRASHKNKRALELIEGAGAEVRFLPVYSPDLNPIEKMWSKIKQILRSKKDRTEKALMNAIAYSLKRVTQKDAEGWFESCGYSLSKNALKPAGARLVCDPPRAEARV